MALKDNLQSYWKLDGNSNDAVVATHNDGTDTAIVYGAIDFYAETNYDNHYSFGSGVTNEYIAQSFTCSNSCVLNQAKFYLKKVVATSLTGNVYAKLYAHSGTYGTSSVPGALTETSTAVDVATGVSTSLGLITFNFAGTTNLTAGSYYEIVVYFAGGDGSNYLWAGVDASSSTASGNSAVSSNGSSWTPDNTIDTIFYVLGTPGGKINQGAGFNGTSSVIAGSSINLASDFSFSCWFKSTQTPVTTNALLFGFDSDKISGLYLRTTGAGRFAVTDDTPVSGFINSSSTLNDGNWHFLVGTKTAGSPNSTLHFYVDGVEQGTGTSVAYTGTFNGRTMHMGLVVATSYFNGAIDECGYWSRALTSGEVTSLWNGGAGLAYPFIQNQGNMFLLF